MKTLFVSLGCDKNTVDTRKMAGILEDGGICSFTEDEAAAEAAVVNTCAFIDSAKQESIDEILSVAQLKKTGKLKYLIVTGCLAQRYQDEILKLIPEVDAVLGTTAEDSIGEVLRKLSEGEKPEKAVIENPDLVPSAARQVLTFGSFVGYLKIAEGCNKCCTYCAIPSIRGHYRSVPMEQILEDARGLAAQGAKELILVAQETTLYGVDLYGKKMLPELLRRLCLVNGIRWIRVLYCYPERITDKLLEVMAREEKLVKYLDIPIQHCNGDILRRMNRQGDADTLAALLNKIRQMIPDITLRTTLITGFPGETEAQFTELAEFIQAQRFDRLGWFAYSQEEGTRAAEFPDQVPEDVRQHRADILMEQQQLIVEEKNNARLGQVCTAVIEGYDRWAECWFGRTAADAPDIDGKVFIRSETPLHIGDYVTVRLDEVLDYDFVGEVVTDESAQ